MFVAEDLPQVFDRGLQFVALSFELNAGELRQAAQLQVEDVGRLDFGEVEDVHQPGASLCCIVRGADQLHNFVNVEDRNEQTLHQVQTVECFLQAEFAAAADDVDPVGNEHLEQGLQPQGAGTAVHQADVVDAEGVFHRGQAVQLFENSFRIETGLDADDQAQAVLAVRVVINRADALQLFGLDVVFDLLDDLFGADEVGKFGYGDAAAARRDVLKLHGCAGAEGAAAGFVGIPHAGQADDSTAGRQVWARDEAHELIQGCVGVEDQVAGRGDDFAGIVRGHVGGHADRDAGRAVDQQVRQCTGQSFGLSERTVVVRHSVDGVFVQVAQHMHGRLVQPGLRVAGSRGAVVKRTEVAVAVDKRDAHDKGLSHAHQRVVDGGVGVRVQLAHDIADNARGLDVGAVGAQPHFRHLVENAALDGLEAVASIRQRAGVDDRVRVFEERRLHFLGDIDIDDLTVGHAASSLCSGCAIRRSV